MKKIIVYCFLLSLCVSVTFPSLGNLVVPVASNSIEPSPESIKAAIAEFKSMS